MTLNTYGLSELAAAWRLSISAPATHPKVAPIIKLTIACLRTPEVTRPSGGLQTEYMAKRWLRIADREVRGQADYRS
ncbi:MAG: hypothetical protein H0X34_12515 [Chthoniobacterales bacterium]|nr:hypothetical protein [Chthoniobacterales bacterium]